MALLSIGLFGFSVSTLAHDDLRRRCDWTHATQARVGARDALQYVGPGQDRISIGGAAYAELSDGAASIDQLRDMADTGEAFPLVDGAGTVFGNYVIMGIDEARKYLYPDGTPRKIEFTVDLLRVADVIDPA